MFKNLLPLALLTSLLAVPAFAATTTGSLTVKATVQESCYLDSGAGAQSGNALIDFGTISNLESNVDADTASAGGAALSIICTNGTTYDVSAGPGTNVDGSQRRMAGAGEFLPYDLYLDSNHATAIVDGTPFAIGTGTGLSQDIDIYGRIPANTTLPAAGNYTDTVTLTVTY